MGKCPKIFERHLISILSYRLDDLLINFESRIKTFLDKQVSKNFTSVTSLLGWWNPQKSLLHPGKVKCGILKREHLTKSNGKETPQNGDSRKWQENWGISACLIGPDLSKKTKTLAQGEKRAWRKQDNGEGF